MVVDCQSISPQSGNIFFQIVDDQAEITSADVFVSTSNHPIIGSWVDGDVTLTDGTNTGRESGTEFDKILEGVEVGT